VGIESEVDAQQNLRLILGLTQNKL